MISFSKVIVENEFRDKVLKLIENDNLLFTIKNALGCDHYFCKKGVVKTNVGWSRETVYYNYSNLSNLEKNWAGVLRDKPSGYKIDMNIMENWQTPIIDFIKSKQS